MRRTSQAAVVSGGSGRRLRGVVLVALALGCGAVGGCKEDAESPGADSSLNLDGSDAAAWNRELDDIALALSAVIHQCKALLSGAMGLRGLP